MEFRFVGTKCLIYCFASESHLGKIYLATGIETQTTVVIGIIEGKING